MYDFHQSLCPKLVHMSCKYNITVFDSINYNILVFLDQAYKIKICNPGEHNLHTPLKKIPLCSLITHTAFPPHASVTTHILK